LERKDLEPKDLERREFLTAAGYAGVAFGGMMITSGAAAKPNCVKILDLPGTPRLQMRRLGRKGGKPVLYIHGATFPAALSVGYRFADGKSWEDSLHRAGFDVWALDFEGFGGSARPASFAQPADVSPIPLRAPDAAQQIGRAVQHIQETTKRGRVSMMAHSWGGVPAALYATKHADTLDRLALFAPALHRPASANPKPMGNNLPNPAKIPAWRALTVAEQLARFVNDTPKGHTSVLAEPMLDRWGPAWLATDANALSRTPPAVQVPTGPQADIMALWSGVDVYDPAAITTPTLIVRGEWDNVCSAADVERLTSRIRAKSVVSEVIPTSGHLAHIENNRTVLWAKVNDFLKSAPVI
jgi:pimeloyl-ACP methyl ester carboxylesterase